MDVILPESLIGLSAILTDFECVKLEEWHCVSREIVDY
jgi:hypothetical protein